MKREHLSFAKTFFYKTVRSRTPTQETGFFTNPPAQATYLVKKPGFSPPVPPGRKSQMLPFDQARDRPIVNRSCDRRDRM